MTNRSGLLSSRGVWLAVGALAIGLVVAASALARDLVLYNHSPSIPVGLYLRSDGPVGVGTIVTVRARDVAPSVAEARGFDDEGDRFIKRVSATEGDEICAEGETISINGEAMARRAAVDSSGRPLPSWSGCIVLATDQFFLLGDTADSFDGRYWGPVSRDRIEGVWRPLRSSTQSRPDDPS